MNQRNYVKGEATKQELLAAAYRVFERNGFLNTIVRDITIEAGKSSGTFYIYFNNKSEILTALINQFDAEILKKVHPNHGGDVAILPDPALWKQRIRAIWQVYSDHRAIFFALTQAAAISPEFHAAERRSRQRAFEDFQNLIKVQQAKGLCQNLDPAITAIALESMLDGFLYENLAEPGHKVHDDAQADLAIETLISLIDIILHAGNTAGQSLTPSD